MKSGKSILVLLLIKPRQCRQASSSAKLVFGAICFMAQRYAAGGPESSPVLNGSLAHRRLLVLVVVLVLVIEPIFSRTQSGGHGRAASVSARAAGTLRLASYRRAKEFRRLRSARRRSWPQRGHDHHGRLMFRRCGDQRNRLTWDWPRARNGCRWPADCPAGDPALSSNASAPAWCRARTARRDWPAPDARGLHRDCPREFS